MSAMRRRSVYTSLADDVPDLVSPYASLDPDEDLGTGQRASAIAQRRRSENEESFSLGGGGSRGDGALGTGDPAETAPIPADANGDKYGLGIGRATTSDIAPKESRYDKLTGGGGDAAAKYGSAEEGDPSLDWVHHAPEAAGTESFSTTPQNQTPRSTTPITKDELPRIDKTETSSKWDNVRSIDEQIKALAARPGDMRYDRKMTTLFRERAAAYNDAVYQDNRRASEPVGKAYAGKDEHGNPVWIQSLKGGATRILGPRDEDARVTAAKIKAERDDRRARAREKGELDVEGHKWFVNPETGEREMETHPVITPAQGPPTPGGDFPTSRYDAPIQFAKPGDTEAQKEKTQLEVAKIHAAATLGAARERGKGKAGEGAKTEGSPVGLKDRTDINKTIASRLKTEGVDAYGRPVAGANERIRAEVLEEAGVVKDENGRLVYGKPKKKKGATPPPPPGFEAVK
jgi:hypothetical protein